MEDKNEIIKLECTQCDNTAEDIEANLRINGWFFNDEEFACMGVMCPACHSQMVEGERREFQCHSNAQTQISSKR